MTRLNSVGVISLMGENTDAMALLTQISMGPSCSSIAVAASWSCFQIVDGEQLDRSPKLIAIDKEPNHGVMHEDGFGETNCSSCQPLDPCPQREMFTFDLLRVEFADGMGRGRQVPLIDACRIGIKMYQPKGLEQLL